MLYRLGMSDRDSCVLGLRPLLGPTKFSFSLASRRHSDSATSAALVTADINDDNP